MADPRHVAVVTGASKGIGRAIAERFARAGYTVWAVARSEEALASLAEANPSVRPLRCDVERNEDILAACKEVLGGGPAPTVLINNAGIALSNPLRKTSLEDYERLMAINVRAPFLFCRELLPAMTVAGHGRIINIASTAGLRGFRYTSIYSASKHALIGLTKSLALELAQKNVTVNAVCPGWTDTDMVTTSAKTIAHATGRTEEEARGALAAMNPMGRLVRPEEVAELCWYLASERAAAVTGGAYVIDAGETA